MLLLASNITTYWYSSEISSIFIKTEETIIAEIQLETNCELMNEAFIAVDLITDKSVSFNLSKAYLRTLDGNPIQIQMNPKFSDVTSNFALHKAQKRMKIEIDCNISNKLKNTLESLRYTFKN